MNKAELKLVLGSENEKKILTFLSTMIRNYSSLLRIFKLRNTDPYTRDSYAPPGMFADKQHQKRNKKKSIHRYTQALFAAAQSDGKLGKPISGKCVVVSA